MMELNSTTEEQECDESSPSMGLDSVNYVSEKRLESEEEFETHNSFPTKFVEIEEETKTTTPPLLENAQKDLGFTKDMVPITTDTSSQEASVGESERASSIQEAPPHENSNSKVDSGNFLLLKAWDMRIPTFWALSNCLSLGALKMCHSSLG
ncbi:hypothetical protein COLO4_20273 [Corchorus olitorius]|uniref:Uncharacterized protein n=1 Tax=Corchorus olitorius TaxID=93759 RepID=A0A1R3J0P1_9ROSI|nr:hypothetical protein COLO4_20273 [Corchorus olitorius]